MQFRDYSTTPYIIFPVASPLEVETINQTQMQNFETLMTLSLKQSFAAAEQTFFGQRIYDTFPAGKFGT